MTETLPDSSMEVSAEMAADLKGRFSRVNSECTGPDGTAILGEYYTKMAKAFQEWARECGASGKYINLADVGGVLFFCYDGGGAGQGSTEIRIGTNEEIGKIVCGQDEVAFANSRGAPIARRLLSNKGINDLVLWPAVASPQGVVFSEKNISGAGKVLAAEGLSGGKLRIQCMKDVGFSIRLEGYESSDKSKVFVKIP